MEYCIVYLSTATKLLDENELTGLLQRWQDKNRALGITGILLYFNGNILQVIEGSQTVVEDLYKVISSDARHTQVIRLYGNLIEQRSFADWAMGYRSFSETDLTQLSDLIAINGEEERTIVRRLAQIFYQNNYRI